MNLDRIQIVLVEPSHPGNIGASARAMKTMGLSRLILVQPLLFPHPEADAMASGADDVLRDASICASLEEATRGSVWVVGTTSRRRSIGWPTFTPHAAIEKISERLSSGPVALVFGRERTGLTNEEVDHCDALIHIPANPEYASLNLAAAVQLLAYECRLAFESVGMAANENGKSIVITDLENDEPASGWPSAVEMEYFYQHLEQVMVHTGFLNPDKPRRLMRRMRRLFARATLDGNELNMLRGLLHSILPATNTAAEALKVDPLLNETSRHAMRGRQ